ncbi:MAG TPA: hypothetical protein VND45_06125, partial [Thermoanaerobaculia bacterium]|nr:hypothetical protein [Thermoanaerobaculia bacterium]
SSWRMTMRHNRITLGLLLMIFGCRPVGDGHTAAASAVTRRYAQSRFERWGVHATAAGRDCSVLLVETSAVLDDSMVEAMHYGIGFYAVEGRGVLQFSRDGAFRGVVYKDSTARLWPYGELTEAEKKELPPCRR